MSPKNSWFSHALGIGVVAVLAATLIPQWTQTAAAAPVSESAAAVNVTTAAQLQAALAAAVPGQTIQLAAGTYRGSFVAQKAGTAAGPITLTGPANAFLINPNVVHASNTVTATKKGLTNVPVTP